MVVADFFLSFSPTAPREVNNEDVNVVILILFYSLHIFLSLSVAIRLSWEFHDMHYVCGGGEFTGIVYDGCLERQQ